MGPLLSNLCLLLLPFIVLLLPFLVLPFLLLLAQLFLVVPVLLLLVALFHQICFVVVVVILYNFLLFNTAGCAIAIPWLVLFLCATCLFFVPPCTRTLAHTLTYRYIYMYICVYLCVCTPLFAYLLICWFVYVSVVAATFSILIVG